MNNIHTKLALIRRFLSAVRNDKHFGFQNNVDVIPMQRSEVRNRKPGEANLDVNHSR